jgi:Tfp pilus assembly protein PilV
MLEVMVGLIIFSLGLLLLGSMMVVAIKGNEWSDKTTKTVQLLRDKIEDLRDEDPAEMVAGSDQIAGISRSWFFEDLATNLKQLTIVVSYVDERDVVQECTTTTYIEVGN